jgi:hypothetical protein
MWNYNGTVITDNAYSPTIDTSGIVFTSGSLTTGYGQITTDGTLTISGQTLRIQNTYTL